MRRLRISQATKTTAENEPEKINLSVLPKPEELVKKEQNVKVTLELSKRSIDLFKRYAKKKGCKYQKMIRILVDTYASKALS